MKLTRPGRADSYEAQLSDEELVTLHAALLGGRLTLQTIQEQSPTWVSGRMAGRKPSLATLSNIRDRLGMRATLEENAATTETLLEELKAEVPGISDDQLAEYGHRAFSLMALRTQDVKSWVALRRTQKEAGDLKLSQQKFRRETCDLFLKWSEDERALDIAASGASSGDKIDRLGQLMFGDDWKE